MNYCYGYTNTQKHTNPTYNDFYLYTSKGLTLCDT